MKTAVLLGGNGFIGSHIKKELLRHDFIIVSPNSNELDLTKPDSQEKLKKILNQDSLLFFAAALTREHGDNLQTMQTNINMAVNVASVLENTFIKKCVFLSSADVYGYPKNQINEETKLDPQTYYAIYKLTAEQILQKATQKLAIPLLIFRYPGIFGPGQKGKYGPNSFIEQGLKGTIQIWGAGNELRDFVFVEDLAKVICRLSKNQMGIFNIVTGQSHSFIQLINSLKQIIPNKFTVIRRERTGLYFDQVFDNNKLHKTIPNFKFTPLLKALKLTYGDYI